MKPTVAVLADYANLESHGKLNIMGIFDVINAPQLPVVHPQMQLVVRLIADSSETGVACPLEIQMVDEDGRTVFGIKGQMTFQPAPSGEQVTANYIVGLNNTRFERFGEYEFKILVCDEPIATIPLKVQKLESPPKSV